MKKRVIAMILIVAMVLALAGCGDGGDTKKLIGKWRCEVDWTELMEQMVLDSNGEFAEYVEFDDLMMVCYAEFRKDGTAVMYVDESQIQETFDAVVDAFLVGIEKYTVDLIYEQTGMSFAFEEIQELTGMDLQAELSNMNLEELVQEVCDEVYQEGKYKAEDGKFYISAGLEYEIDPEVYETYTLDGNTFTLTSSVGGNDTVYSVYPMVFEKIG